MRLGVDSQVAGHYHQHIMTARTKRGQKVLLILLIVLVCPLLISIFWYPLKAARVVAKTRTCMDNLKGLGIAVDLYRQANGRFPAKLSDLYPKYINNLGSFSCPGNPHEIFKPEDIDSSAGYVLFRVDIPVDTSETDWMDKPLLSDRRRNHLGKTGGVWGGNILYADGHVQWMPDVHPTEPYTSDLVTSNFSFNFPD
jgi:prepilin-type processing-associated H-X9-DG protein